MWRGTQTLLKAKILKRPENFRKNKAFHISSIRLLSFLFFCDLLFGEANTRRKCPVI